MTCLSTTFWQWPVWGFFLHIDIFNTALANESRTSTGQTIWFPKVSLFLTFTWVSFVLQDAAQSDYSMMLNHWTVGFVTRMLSAPFQTRQWWVVAIVFITNASVTLNTFSSEDNKRVGTCNVLWLTNHTVSSVGMPLGLTSFPFTVSGATLPWQREGTNTFQIQ